MTTTIARALALFCVALFVFPLIVLGASSENYQLDQEGVGFVEFDGSSSNFELKAAVGSAGTEASASTNYIIDQGRVWAVTAGSSGGSSSSGSTGGGGGSSSSGGSSGDVITTGATFSGRAYPLSNVRLLKDGQTIATTPAGPDAYFKISVTGINAGRHTFVIVGIDDNGLTSQSQSFSIEVSTGAVTEIGGIFLAPTLAVDKKEVRQGDNLAIFGQTVPESFVTIGVASGEESFTTAVADFEGVFLYNLDTAPLIKGNHETRAKSAKDGAISGFGHTVSFVVGNKNIFNENIGCVERGDLNSDCRVNLVDFSIAAYWYKKSLSAVMRTRETVQLNGDGDINLADLSIMAFYWTG